MTGRPGDVTGARGTSPLASRSDMDCPRPCQFNLQVSPLPHAPHLLSASTRFCLFAWYPNHVSYRQQFAQFVCVRSVCTDTFVGVSELSVIRWVKCHNPRSTDKLCNRTRSTQTSRDDGCYTHSRFRGKVVKTQPPLQRQVVHALFPPQPNQTASGT